MLTILAIMALILVLVLPIWPYSRHWSGVPGAMILFVLVTFIAFILAGRIVA